MVSLIGRHCSLNNTAPPLRTSVKERGRACAANINGTSETWWTATENKAGNCECGGDLLHRPFHRHSLTKWRRRGHRIFILSRRQKRTREMPPHCFVSLLGLTSFASLFRRHDASHRVVEIITIMFSEDITTGSNDVFVPISSRPAAEVPRMVWERRPQKMRPAT